ncbi:MAG: ATP phosphoribosyltransferase [Bdellovibrionales bacterium]|nr:ATP phosphoribosyltransferase [Bdellovibrionales bacterium]
MKTNSNRIRIAIQKSGRLAEKSIHILNKCGLDLDLRKDRLLHSCTNFPVDLMFVRDDDIPEYVADGVCEIGVVGINILEEKYLSIPDLDKKCFEILFKMGFGHCRLSLAVPDDFNYISPQSLNGLRIASSYPSCLRRFLSENKIQCEIIELSGSVEIAPNLKIADAICDLVSTGATLRSNGLKEVTTLLSSEACLVKTCKPINPEPQLTLDYLLRRLKGVLMAQRSKYIMMNAPKSSIEQIKKLIPGMEEPTIMSLTDSEKVALHAVASEDIFWETLEKLKAVGASSILVLPIEKVIA